MRSAKYLADLFKQGKLERLKTDANQLNELERGEPQLTLFDEF